MSIDLTNSLNVLARFSREEPIFIFKKPVQKKMPLWLLNFLKNPINCKQCNALIGCARF